MRLRTASFTNGVRFACGLREERTELIEGRRRCHGVPETNRSTGQVVPNVGTRDGLIDQAVGRSR
jgi:hypothetical protein